jgi:hypothetical protein
MPPKLRNFTHTQQRLPGLDSPGGCGRGQPRGHVVGMRHSKIWRATGFGACVVVVSVAVGVASSSAHGRAQTAAACPVAGQCGVNPNTGRPTGTGAVHGHFRLVARFYSQNHLRHAVCSYLINRATRRTYAHGARYWSNA